MRRDYLDYLHDLFSAFAPVTTRSRFGGHGVYRDGLILAIVIDEVLYLKVDDATRADFEAEGCAPFLYEARGKRIPMSYWSVPEFALDFYKAVRARDHATIMAGLRDFVLPYIALRNRGKGYAVSIVKAGMTAIGRTAGPVRTPLVDLKPAEMDELKALIARVQPAALKLAANG